MSAPATLSPVASLRDTPADPKVVDALEKAITSAHDDDLCRINALAFARNEGLPEEQVVDGFLRASRLGIFDLSWATSCPGCGGVVDDSSLRGFRDTSRCEVCDVDYDVDLDERVEVTFTVHPRVRRIHAHDPLSLDAADNYRLLHVSSRFVVPRREEFGEYYRQFTYFALGIAAGERVVKEAVLGPGRASLAEMGFHVALHIDCEGAAVTERRDIEVTISEAGIAPRGLKMAPGPVRFGISNVSSHALLVGLVNRNLTDAKPEREEQPYLTAKRLFSNQTFRELYRTDMVSVDQRLRITSLTFVFTDLKGSTELYERVGDLAAYDLVRHHFDVLGREVREHGGAVVKTIGDAVMATFPTADRGLRAAIRMRAAMDRFNKEHGREELLVKIGVHEGPCLAVVSNERLDYFGQTVNIAARVQGIAESRRICTTEPVVKDPAVDRILESEKLFPCKHTAKLKGISEDVVIFEIP